MVKLDVITFGHGCTESKTCLPIMWRHESVQEMAHDERGKRKRQ